ncbi:hypothetical protein OSB04_028547 [Centaurea solstitialis]|uniref:F-box associated beta-propeller type 3 domain-containing protein n=1 Tax=Centaurea solstitialis TaxID=347529 RepID=A0AA38SU92_9ASTR|nr:hypothetical protein OSB04_028547 [Centaurea solstitialis]
MELGSGQKGSYGDKRGSSLDQFRIIDSSCGLLCLDGFFLEPDNSKMHMYPKLVNITYVHNYSENPCQVMVFTLRPGEWRCLCSNRLPRESIRFDDRSQTIIGQFIYWLAYDWIDHMNDGDGRNLIMSFDLSTNEFKMVDLPDSLAKLRAKLDFSVSSLRDSLAVIEYTHSGSDSGLTWKQVCTTRRVMDHGDSKAFPKLFTIKVHNTRHVSVAWTLGFRKSGEHIHILELGIGGNRHSFSGSLYTESLHLLDHVDGHIVRRLPSINFDDHECYTISFHQMRSASNNIIID